jgi:hypothetical protein
MTPATSVSERVRGVLMKATIGRAARRELAVVFGLASSGIALVLVVAFAPWYGPMMAPNSGAPAGVVVVQTEPPPAAANTPR